MRRRHDKEKAEEKAAKEEMLRERAKLEREREDELKRNIAATLLQRKFKAFMKHHKSLKKNAKAPKKGKKGKKGKKK